MQQCRESILRHCVASIGERHTLRASGPTCDAQADSVAKLAQKLQGVQWEDESVSRYGATTFKFKVWHSVPKVSVRA